MLFLMPAAASPTCTNMHLTSILKEAAVFKEKQIKVVVATLDKPDAVDAWLSRGKAKELIDGISDVKGQLTLTLDLFARHPMA